MPALTFTLAQRLKSALLQEKTLHDDSFHERINLGHVINFTTGNDINIILIRGLFCDFNKNIHILHICILFSLDTDSPCIMHVHILNGTL